MCEEIHLTDFFSLILKDANKLFADNFAFHFGSRNTFKFCQEPVPRVYANKADIKGASLAENRTNTFAFIFTQQAVIDENAGKLLADGTG